MTMLDLPVEIIGHIMGHMDSASLVHTLTTSKQMLSACSSHVQSNWNDAMGRVAAILRGPADWVDICIKEVYTGGAQPEDGDFDALAPTLFSCRIGNAADEAEQSLAHMLASSDQGRPPFPPLTFVSINLSWSGEYELDFDSIPARPKLPVELQREKTALESKMTRLFQRALVVRKNIL
jgi:hypothetical protein